MKNLMAISTKDKEDGLKYAYAFMQTKQLNLKECSFINPKPTKMDEIHIIPRDMYSASYKENIPTWEDFKTNPTHISSAGISCVACLDIKDEKRVTFILFEGIISFNCYGDYEMRQKRLLKILF